MRERSRIAITVRNWTPLEKNKSKITTLKPNKKRILQAVKFKSINILEI